jgi:hypothetical protein
LDPIDHVCAEAFGRPSLVPLDWAEVQAKGAAVHLDRSFAATDWARCPIASQNESLAVADRAGGACRWERLHFLLSQAPATSPHPGHQLVIQQHLTRSWRDGYKTVYRTESESGDQRVEEG